MEAVYDALKRVVRRLRSIKQIGVHGMAVDDDVMKRIVRRVLKIGRASV
jgi:hypothetical protein